MRPILADNCFQCHGPDESTRQVRLRLDTEEGAFGERPNGHPVVRGDAAASLIFQRITHANSRLRMPPAETNKTLTDEQIDVLRRWMDEGASWDQHWAFKSIVRPEPPAVVDPATGRAIRSIASSSRGWRPRDWPRRRRPTGGRWRAAPRSI